MTRQRDRIHRHIQTHPGRHFSGLARALDLAPGQLQYHLRSLRQDDRVVEESLYGRTHYFPPSYDDRERGAIAVLRRETARDILLYVLEHGPARPNDVAESVGIARSTLEWHLDHLIEQSLLRKDRDSQNRVLLVVPSRRESVELLEQITLSMSDRLLDRFTRLVDNLLPE